MLTAQKENNGVNRWHTFCQKVVIYVVIFSRRETSEDPAVFEMNDKRVAIFPFSSSKERCCI